MMIVCWRWGWAAGTVDLGTVYIGLADSVTPCIFKVCQQVEWTPNFEIFEHLIGSDP